MYDSSEDQSNSMSVSSISSGSSYYCYSDVGDTYEYDEDSKIEKEIIQDQKTISGQEIDKKYESDILFKKQLRTHKIICELRRRLKKDKSNSMIDSIISAGSSYYYYSDGDTYKYGENSKIEKEISQDQKTISGQKIDKKYESTLNTVDTKEADISSAKKLRTHKRKKIQETITEPEKKYKCLKYARIHEHRQSLYTHKKFECGVTPQFICKFCDKQFKRKSTMNSHLVRVHQLPISNQKKQKIQKSKQENIGYRHQKTNLNISQPKHICDKCSQAYISLSGLRYHNLAKHVAVKPEFICDFCGYQTNAKLNLSKHIFLRHLKNPKTSIARYNCDKCNLGYNLLRNLRRHERMKHAAVKPQFTCEDCGYKTDIKSNLSMHISSQHLKSPKTSRARYNCDKCNLGYNLLRNLRRHERIKHAAVKPQFTCEDCGYKTDIKSNLSKHISSQHLKSPKTSRARYNCDKCNLGYNLLRNLRRHERIKHAAVKPQFLCEDCGYKTDVKCSLSKHISSRHFK